MCLDAFLYHFTILPARIALAVLAALVNFFAASLRLKGRIQCLWPDLLKGIMVLAAVYGLKTVDASRLYHSIRGQSTLKLYVIYNVLEVADKLFCSFGLDILDSFFSKQAADINNRLRPLPHFLLAIVYVFLHTVVLFYQVITLNVAINSYSNALLTLLVSNQFVEIKSAVFKKFEKENLFQLACADVVERFQLTLYLVIIGIRNIPEFSSNFSLWFVGERLLAPLAVVYVSEIFVDWLKHAFITKFNHIHPDVYLKFCSILAKDFETMSEGAGLVDQSPQVSRRIGFSVFPLSCLLIRVVMQIVLVYQPAWSKLLPHIIGSFGCLFILKLIIGMNLSAYCRRRTHVMAQKLTAMPPKKLFSSQSQMILEESKKTPRDFDATPVKPLSRSSSVGMIEDEKEDLCK